MQKKWWRYHVPRKSKKGKSRKGHSCSHFHQSKPLPLWPSTNKEVSFMTHAKWPCNTLQLVGHKSLFEKKGLLNYPFSVFSAWRTVCESMSEVIASDMVGSSSCESKSIRPKVIPRPPLRPPHDWPRLTRWLLLSAPWLGDQSRSAPLLPGPLPRETRGIPCDCCFAPQ